MKTKELIKILKRFPEDAEVMTYDPDTQGYENITGFVFNPENMPTILLFTDEQKCY